MSTRTYFNGEMIAIPGAYSAIDTSAMNTRNDWDNAKTIALVGESDGGEPGVVHFFTDPITARKTLKGGDLLKAAEKAWKPVTGTKQGVSLGGAATIACVRTNRATKSRLDIVPNSETSLKQSRAAQPIEAKTQVLGKAAGDLIESPMILSDGSVMGTLKYVKDFKAFNESVKAEQNGYFFPVKLNVTGKTMTIIKNGEERADKKDMAFDPELVLRVEDANDRFAIFVDGKAVITFNFKKCSLGTEEADIWPQIRFESRDWGADTTHQIKIANGTLLGTKKVTIYDQSSGIYESFDNLGNLFTLSYNGPEKYAAYEVAQDPADQTLFFNTYIGDNAESAELDISIKLDKNVYKSITALMQAIEVYENYQINAANRFNQRIPVDELDITYARKSIVPKPGTAAPRVTAVYSDIARTLNMNSQFVQVTAINSEYGELENMPYTSLEGGSNGTSPASWAKFFEDLSDFDTYYIVPLTGDMAVHAELASHIDALSGNLGRERRGVIGGYSGETIEETISRAQDVRHPRMQLVHGGCYDYDKGQLKLNPPYILAAQHAGRCAALEDGESATHDVYSMVNPEYKLQRQEITRLLDAGVLAFEYVLGRNGSNQSSVRLVHDLTTDISSTDTVHVERATGALADSINMEIRERFDALFTGKRMSTRDIENAKVAIMSVLQRRQRMEQILAFKDIYIVKEGTIMEVHYSVAPAEPNNFTLITAHYYSESLSA